MDKPAGVDVHIGQVLAAVFLAVAVLAVEAGLDVATQAPHPPSVTDCN